MLLKISHDGLYTSECNGGSSSSRNEKREDRLNLMPVI
jgi:hypothetical protein